MWGPSYNLHNSARFAAFSTGELQVAHMREGVKPNGPAVTIPRDLFAGAGGRSAIRRSPTGVEALIVSVTLGTVDVRDDVRADSCASAHSIPPLR